MLNRKSSALRGYSPPRLRSQGLQPLPVDSKTPVLAAAGSAIPKPSRKRPASSASEAQASGSEAPDADAAQAGGSKEKDYQKQRSRERKRVRRANDDDGEKGIRFRGRKVRDAVICAPDDFCLEELLHASTGFSGRTDIPGTVWLPGYGGSPEEQLDYLLRQGFRLTKGPYKKDIVMVDRKGRVYAVILAPPCDDWDERIKRVTAAIEKLASVLPKGHKLNRRGGFGGITVGFSGAQGRQMPQMYDLRKADEAIEEFFANPDVIAWLDFMEKAMSTWFPRHVKQYQQCTSAVLAEYPDLRLPSATSFPAITINTGPQTVCELHRDEDDWLPCIGPNAPAGNYNPEKGGHFVMYEPRRILSLSPGATVLFPPAIISHFNIGIGPGETRYSVDPFYPASLMRYWAQEWKTQKVLAATNPKRAEVLEAQTPDRLKRAFALFSTIAELKTLWSPEGPKPTKRDAEK